MNIINQRNATTLLSVIHNTYKHINIFIMSMDLSIASSVAAPGQAIIAYDSEFSPTSARAAADAAYMRVMEFEANSTLVKRYGDTAGAISRLDWPDIVVRGLLGVGGFACVCKVRVPILEDDEEDEDHDDQNPAMGDGRSETGSDTAGTSACGSSSTSSSSGAPFYALKCLNQRTVSSEDSFVQGAADLASEAMILSHLQHDNIVRLYGVKNGCVSDAFREQGGYFLLLELLRGTVSDLLRLWRVDLKTAGKAAKIPSPLERIQGIALGVAKGMEYLHQNNVLLRDLKPHNIGFDREGNVRLFDFGLAREIDCDTLDNRIGGVAGSYRYMSPEVALGQGCCFGSDVYSYGIVLWELLTLEKPFEKIRTSAEFKEKVARQGHRPPTRSIHTASLRNLLKDCWAASSLRRPNFTEVCKVLDAEIVAAPSILQLTKPATMREHFHSIKKQMRKQIQERRSSLMERRRVSTC
jgi:serine/threonine protein kinase